MKSPFTGKEMKLVKDKRSMEFRKEKFNIIFHYYLCEDSMEQFTDIKLDELNINQLHNQYRDKHNIPFPDEIKLIRQKYKLSQNKICKILGFGANVYRGYEVGDVPSLSNAKLIQLANDPKGFIKLVEMVDDFNMDVKNDLINEIEKLIKDEEQNSFDIGHRSYLLGNVFPNIFSGYKRPSFEKLTNMILYFGEKLNPFKTKMNKLLFYSDFLMFKKYCFSISGVKYLAIDRGPVPDNFQSIYDYLKNDNYIEFDIVDFGEYYGEKIINVKNFDKSLFSETELEILDFVATHFADINSTAISDISHTEKAWMENHQNKKIINYNYAFDLQSV
ncbi:DUF4065 domain-containing protein [Chryseobacterium nematophagum]|uniref:DUF4065 domain-containing protein n=1 Tax=Chryseobacterium nematophagum TaxID=2305228 RepID=A0A3M7TKB6_9FLAO|nr:type II toxin-antitoxin system antitoxin SocA domain-containing protein [Chryseobacterium nematophagum]RNA63089.1 DUF4065 domain-containing protein [Chryseobacterium nematophagum]